MARLCLLIAFFTCVFFVPVLGQLRTRIEGHIYEKDTRRPVEGVRVLNLANAQSTLSDTAGYFDIPAKNGDRIVFDGFAYKSDTLFVYRLDHTTVFLKPKINELAEVRIGANVPDMSGWVWRSGRRARRERPVKITGKIPTGGINNFFRRKKRDARNKMKWEIQEEIDRRFSPLSVGQYIPLKGTELQDFIDLYKPTAVQYIARNFDYFLYLNDAYKAFQALPPEKRKLPPLVE
ncbi:MAG: hypothetical protein INR69_03785 [Mucilaginibacter polytrichastri]|nr:hypothetical protein [Mucilaginibacter polytrichastri]